MAGLGAGVSEALLIVTPFEVVKTRLQQQKGTDKALLKYRVRCGSSCCSSSLLCLMGVWQGAAQVAGTWRGARGGSACASADAGSGTGTRSA